MLRPLVRLLISSGVTFPLLVDLLRELYVDVARHDLLSDPKMRTDRRVSRMTGVHRKNLRRQRLAGASEAAAPLTASAQIVAHWLGLPTYTDTSGHPRPLPCSGDAASFEGLVAMVARDLRPHAVLEEWVRQGLVTLDAEGRVHLQVMAFLPGHGSEAQLFYFARNLHDHAAAAVANVLASGIPPFLDRSVHYDRLGARAAAALVAEGRKAAQQMLLEVNRKALALLEADDPAVAAPEQGVTRRVNLGVYLFVQDENADAPG
ncbi:DUF6502 family protein [Rhodovastum atsumiense]|uniref:DUF6502 family protein n=1 Tax=Rhodovastum atsumiense TaxID=504468 RepID=UPI002025457A|nr:DUF6502 family protein [Rhodovastum atsumiense]